MAIKLAPEIGLDLEKFECYFDAIVQAMEKRHFKKPQKELPPGMLLVAASYAIESWGAFKIYACEMDNYEDTIKRYEGEILKQRHINEQLIKKCRELSKAAGKGKRNAKKD